MSWTSLGLALAGVLCVSGAQILFKLAAAGFNDPDASLVGRWLQLSLVAAIALYAIATVLWLLALGRAKLVVVYPLMATTYIVVPLLAWWWLGEQPSLRTWLGSALVLAGVAIAAR
jgi:drug/metabolite transporter (DMT)-like permease